jgi:hypothetical protein
MWSEPTAQSTILTTSGNVTPAGGSLSRSKTCAIKGRVSLSGTLKTYETCWAKWTSIAAEAATAMGYGQGVGVEFAATIQVAST